MKTPNLKTMKNLLLSIILTILCVCPVMAQEAQSVEKATKVIGGIHDGKPSPPSAPKPKPNFKIMRSQVNYVNGRKVIFNKVMTPLPAKIDLQPTQPLSEEEIAKRNEAIQKWISDIKESGGFFTVSATIYDHKTTYVRWWNGKVEYACYSNVDWNHLGGFHEFEGRGKRFSMIMFSANTTAETLEKELKAGYRNSLPNIPKLPTLSERGAAYMVVKGDENNDEAMEFIEAIHDLYDEHRTNLTTAWRERKKNQRIQQKKNEELRKNPPPKPPIVVNWTLRKNGIDKSDTNKNPKNESTIPTGR